MMPNDQQAPNQFDDYISGQLAHNNGTEPSSPEAALAGQLIGLSKSIKPDAGFVNDLEQILLSRDRRRFAVIPPLPMEGAQGETLQAGVESGEPFINGTGAHAEPTGTIGTSSITGTSATVNSTTTASTSTRILGGLRQTLGNRKVQIALTAAAVFAAILFFLYLMMGALGVFDNLSIANNLSKTPTSTNTSALVGNASPIGTQAPFTSLTTTTTSTATPISTRTASAVTTALGTISSTVSASPTPVTTQMATRTTSPSTSTVIAATQTDTTVPLATRTPSNTLAPTNANTSVPTTAPTSVPPTSVPPTGVPPTSAPTRTSTPGAATPTRAATTVPTRVNTGVPTTVTTTIPTRTNTPDAVTPTRAATTVPTRVNTAVPTSVPTTVPTRAPTRTNTPAVIATNTPNTAPTRTATRAASTATRAVTRTSSPTRTPTPTQCFVPGTQTPPVICTATPTPIPPTRTPTPPGWIDNIPPTLVDLSFVPNPVDITNSDQTIIFTWHLTDQGDGIATAASSGGTTQLWIASPDWSLWLPIYLDESHLVSGDLNDGIFETLFTLPRYSRTGTWRIQYAVLYDNAGNSTYVSSSMMTAMGINTQLVVAGTSETTPPAVVDLSLSPSSVDVTNGDQAITVTWHITDAEAGVSTDSTANPASLSLISPSGQNYLSTNAGTWQLISGTVNDGIFQNTLTIPQFSEAGIWRIESLNVQDRVGNWLYMAGSDLAAMGINVELTVTGTSDTSPPTLANLTFAPTSINTDNGDYTITFTWQMQDDPAGLSTDPSMLLGELMLRSPSGQTYMYSSVYYSSLVAGDNHDGTYQTTLTIPQSSEAGNWQIESVWLQDRINNSQYFTGSELATMGFATQLQVIGSYELTPPTLVDLSFAPNPVDISDSDQTVTVSWHLTDEIAGVSTDSAANPAMLYLMSPSGQRYASTTYGTWQLVSGTTNDGIFQNTFTLPRFSETGSWQITSVYVQDQAGNSRYMSASDLAAMGIPTELAVTGVSDTTAPTLVDLSFTPTTIDVTDSAQTVTLNWHLTDAESGVSTDSMSNPATLYLISPSGQRYASTTYGTWQLVSGTANDGIFQNTLTVPRLSEAGSWQITSVYVQDQAGNTRYMYGSDLPAMGINAQLTVTRDTTPPTLVDLSFTPITVDITDNDQTITLTWYVTDDRAGIGTDSSTYTTSLTLMSPSGQRYLSTDSGTWQIISGTANDGIFQNILTVPRFSEVGAWQIESLWMQDRIGNSVFLSNSDLASIGITSQLMVTGASDTTPPTLTNLTLAPTTVDVSASTQIVTVTWGVADTLSGFSSGSLYVYSPSGYRFYTSIGAGELVSGDAQNGTYQSTVYIPYQIESGTWFIGEVNLYDTVGNSVLLTTADLNSLGINTQIIVTNGGATPTETPTYDPTATNNPSTTPSETLTPTEVAPIPTTPAETATDTNTAIPTETNTPIPTETSTPVPTATDVPIPTDTDTPEPPTITPEPPTLTPIPSP